MLGNRRLARHIADANWAQIRRQLTYKTQRTGVRLAAQAADTGELRREQPDRTDVRPPQPAAVAIGPLREESNTT